MVVNTSRFGEVEIDDSRVITFRNGLLGFPDHKEYVLIQTGEDSYFYWMQSLQAPDLAFVVTDPSHFVSSYRVPIRPEHMRDLGIGSLDEAQVFVVVNKRGNVLTGNLQGPLIIHVNKLVGEQLVLSDRRFTTRAPLIELPTGVTAAAG